MIQLADEVFATKSDPNQLDINQVVIDRLRMLHPATISEYDEGNGPVAWIVLIPTTLDLMRSFVQGNISEKDLFAMTMPGKQYDAIYLCSAMVLKEYRRKGVAKRLTLAAIDSIREDHPVQALFVWAFSKAGDIGSEKMAVLTALPLYKRERNC